MINITFDNVHFFRDNPNVPSDVEKMPNLLNFIQNNGTLMSNHHTPLIAHTADDSLTQYIGLYGDRHGMGVSNSYEYYNGTTPVKADSFVYWTSPIIDSSSQTPSATDPNPSMIYSEQVPAVQVPSASTGHASISPAPWPVYTKAGCNVGMASTANMVLEKYADVATVFGSGSPEAQQVANDTDSFKNAEIDDYIGMSIHCGQWNGVNDPVCVNAQARKYQSTSPFIQPNPSPTAAAEGLPDEPGGYSNFLAVHGSRYVTPVLGGGPNVSHNGHLVTDANGNLVDLSGNTIWGPRFDKHPGQATNQLNPGFPGFSPTASQTLAYIADMQEAGVQVTYGYISDAHDKKSINGTNNQKQTGCSSPGNALGPADPCYNANLAADDAAFAQFFQRLADAGINSSNTLFIFSSEENDHYAVANVGLALQPTCSGTPGTTGYTCTYNSSTAPVGEVQINVHTLLANQRSNSTPFYSEPQGEAIFVSGSQTNETIRQLERDWGTMSANNPYVADANQQVMNYMADPFTEALLHFANADPNRTPTFTVFPKGEYFFSSGTSDSCPGVTPSNANTACSSINSGFAYDHGYYAPEINITWWGMVGPGVAQHGLDGQPATFQPDQTKTVPENSAVGTWVDETDMRPTTLALLGLTDSFVGDGRVVVENLTVTPGATGDPDYVPLAECYKQLNSSVGQFGTYALIGDTRSLVSGGSSDDSHYSSFQTSLAALGSQRDALATQMKQNLWNAAFGAGLSGDTESELQSCQEMIVSMQLLPEPSAELGLAAGVIALVALRRRSSRAAGALVVSPLRTARGRRESRAPNWRARAAA